MQHQETARSGGVELGEIVERQIVQRTWGRIHRLKVDVDGERLVVRGCTASYYAKQLALEAVLQVLGTADATAVELDIQVSNTRPRSAPEANGRWGDA